MRKYIKLTTTTTMTKRRMFNLCECINDAIVGFCQWRNGQTWAGHSGDVVCVYECFLLFFFLDNTRWYSVTCISIKMLCFFRAVSFHAAYLVPKWNKIAGESVFEIFGRLLLLLSVFRLWYACK